jgi:tRNA G18 (ribose-2'-O)-methylase SpoU
LNVGRIDDPGDPRVSDYASVGDERALRARGVFIGEGRLVVQRLLSEPQYRLRSLLLNDTAASALDGALRNHAGVASDEVPVYVCSPRFFERLTGHHFHRGCLALAARPASADPLALARAASSMLVLDAVGNPDNVGSVFRSALAFGVGAVWLGPGCADPLSRKAIRTSVAATLRVPFATVDVTARDWVESLARLEAMGVELVALTPREPATELGAYPPGPPAARRALLIGSEGDGLSDEVLALASTRLRIEMQGGVDSLNLGVAAGIALYQLTRR